MLRLTIVLILTAVIAAPADAAVIVSSPHVKWPALAVNASGRTAVAWTRSVDHREFVEARLGARPTKLAPPVRIVEGSVADLALGADGTAALAIRTRSRLLIAIARPGHSFGRPQAFPALAGDVQVAVQPDGNVVAIRTVWGPMPDVAPHRELLFTSARAGVRFGAFQALAGEVGIADASLAIDPRDGTALLFYGNGYSGEPFAGFRLAVAPFVLGGTTFGPARTIASGASDPGYRPQAVVGPGGVGVAYNDLSAAWFSRRAADGSWPAPQPFATVPLTTHLSPESTVAALPSDGGAVAVRTSTPAGEPDYEGHQHYRVAAAVRLPSGAFGAPQELNRFVGGGLPPLAVAAGDEAFVLTTATHGPVVLATRAAGASALTRRTLSAAHNGAALLTAAGRHVLAAFVRDGRLRLTVVR